MSLASIFLDRNGTVRRAELAPSAARIDAALRAAWEAGRATWPDVVLAAGAFAAHVGDRVRPSGCAEDAIAALRAPDLYLACACALGIPAALAALERVHLSRVPDFVRRVDRSAVFADEVAQTMREALLVAAPGARCRIAEYSGRGALVSWLRVVAVRTALRLRDEQRPAPAARETEERDELPGVVHPELDWLKLRYRGAYQAALASALAALSDRDALLLKLHYVDGLDIDRIGLVFGMHRSTIARWRAGVRERLVASTRERLQRLVPLSASEYDSVLALVRSQLAVSIRAALSRRAGRDG